MWTFKHLISRFRVDGDQITDIKTHIIVTNNHHHLRQDEEHMILTLNTRVFENTNLQDWSLLTSNILWLWSWRLDSKACKMLKGANSRTVVCITGHTLHEEVISAKSFDLVSKIRSRKLKWIGHILRMSPDRLVHKTVHHMHVTRPEPTLGQSKNTRNNSYVTSSTGDLLMDILSKFR